MAEIAKLVEVLIEEDKATDLYLRLRSDSAKLGLRKFCSILKLGLESIGNGKLGFDSWNQSQIQAVVSVAQSIVSATKSLSGTFFYLSISLFVFLYIHLHVYFWVLRGVLNFVIMLCVFMVILWAVDQSEPIVIATVQHTLEFATSYLEKSEFNGDDFSIQVCNYFYFYYYWTKLWWVNLDCL